MKKILITLLLLIAVLLAIPQAAFAYGEPIVTIMLDKESIEVGEIVTATYRIEGSGDYSDIRWAASMWVSEYENQITGDSQGELSNLTGSISYAPRFGEALSIGISFEDETGRTYWFEGERIPITGYTFIEPKVEIQYDRDTVAIGENVITTYRIENSQDYTNIRWTASMWVSEYENQITGDSQGELSNLTGSISYAPRFGEALSIGISFEDETGRTYWFEGERIPITGYTFIEPKVEIQYDRDTVAIGENVITTYRIENSQDYTNIRWAASMWVSEYENQITVDSQGELSNLTGSISYAPRFGEALSIGISFEDEVGRMHWFDGVQLPISGYAEGYDTYCITEGQDTQLSTGESSLTFRADGDFEKYLGVQVDGKTVPSKHVKAWPGSTYVELSAEYLASLPEGEHELTIVFDDGVAVTRFATMKSLPEMPQAGDHSMPINFLLLMLVVSLGCLAWMAKRRCN